MRGCGRVGAERIGGGRRRRREGREGKVEGVSGGEGRRG